MKRAYILFVTLIFIISIFSPLTFAEKPEKKSDEANKVETKIIIKKEKPENEDIIKHEKEINIFYKSDEMFDLIREVRRLREEIEHLRDEIARLRRLIEERPERPLIRRSMGNPPRKFEDAEQFPPREFRNEEPKRKDLDDINLEIKRLEDKVKRDPKNVDARMMLADLYREIGNTKLAIEQYEAVIKIRPDFDPPYKAIDELKNNQEQAKPKFDFNMGEVISSSIEEVELKTLEGDITTLKVPKWQKEDGTWATDKEIGGKAESLKIGSKVKITWELIEGEKIIRSIEPMNEK